MSPGEATNIASSFLFLEAALDQDENREYDAPFRDAALFCSLREKG